MEGLFPGMRSVYIINVLKQLFTGNKIILAHQIKNRYLC